MNIRMTTVLLFTCLLVIFTSHSGIAGRADKSGTAAAPQLLIPVGPRMIALGGTSIATINGIEALYWNPAGITKSKFESNATFSHVNYLADIGVEYVAISSAFEGLGTLGLSIKSLSFGDIAVTTEEQPDGTGELTSPTFFTLGVTYAKQLADRVSVGLTLSHITEKIERASAAGIAFNVGVQYSGVGGVDGLNLGVVVKNIGPQMQYEGTGLLREGSVEDLNYTGSLVQLQAASAELPSVMEIGLGYNKSFDEVNSLSFSGLFQNNNFSDDEYKIGLEYSYSDLLFLRGGYSQSAKTTELESIFGGTYGIGFHQNLGDVDLSIDYAFRSAEYFGGNHVFGVILGF
ncbi:MAG: PorV/PorQ family protein [Ignavibacteriae bacterium]|nr:PorV/PorQ family protein [Ignavibacteriota bacterium]